MKHYFVINPIAGKENQSEKLTKEIESIFIGRENEYQIYITKGIGDAQRYVRKHCESIKEDITFYACGGDGTTNEVANGLIGSPHAHLSIIKTGSCNDFLKNFPDYDFRNIEKAVNGSIKLIDTLKVNDRYTINVANIGFDAKVNADACEYKIKNMKTAYNFAIARNLLSKMSRYALVEADGKVIYEGKMLLMTFANGAFYGGGYNCAPRAICDDGLQEITIIKKVSRFTLIRLLKAYRYGKHITNPKFQNIVTYQQAKKTKIISPKVLNVCLDGENFLWQEIEIEVMEKAIKMIFPKCI